MKKKKNTSTVFLLDEYDTPMQEAYVNNYWEALTSFTRNLFNAAFKNNPYLERAIMTGITMVAHRRRPLGGNQIKETFETLLSGESITTEINEQIIYNEFNIDESAIWSLLLASGYLKVKACKTPENSSVDWKQLYELQITNLEVMIMFRSLVRNWFASSAPLYGQSGPCHLQPFRHRKETICRNRA